MSEAAGGESGGGKRRPRSGAADGLRLVRLEEEVQVGTEWQEVAYLGVRREAELRREHAAFDADDAA